MEKGLLEKTGKSLDEWKKVLSKQNFTKHGEILKYLKEEHGFTHGFANFVSLKTRETDAGSHDGEQLIAQQYSKGKEHLKPIYDKLREEISKFGGDIDFVPKMKNLSVRRKKQFALIQPSTKTRIDLGLKLKDIPQEGRLGGSGSFGTMCTHCVRLSTLNEVDKELINWLKLAYEKAQ